MASTSRKHIHILPDASEDWSHEAMIEWLRQGLELPDGAGNGGYYLVTCFRDCEVTREARR